MTFDLGKWWGSNLFLNLNPACHGCICVHAIPGLLWSRSPEAGSRTRLAGYWQQPRGASTSGQAQSIQWFDWEIGYFIQLNKFPWFHGWELLSPSIDFSFRNWIQTWLAANCQGSTLLSVSAMTLSIADVNRAFKAAKVSWTRLGSADSHQNTRVSVGCIAGGLIG